MKISGQKPIAELSIKSINRIKVNAIPAFCLKVVLLQMPIQISLFKFMKQKELP